MQIKLVSRLMAGVFAPFLMFGASIGNGASLPDRVVAQTGAETGQVGSGVRGTTGEDTGGQPYTGGQGPAETGGQGATGTGSEGATGTGGQGPGATGATPGTEGATSMGQPGSPENHVQEAMKHAQAAADAGKKGDAAGVAEHARIAKDHVKMANKEKPDNVHLKAAMKSLNDAIEESGKGSADQGRKAAEAAMTHLNAVK
jgi:hypothetical protein